MPPRVLIVDDSAVARAALSRFVAGSGRFEVAGAFPKADSALAFLREQRVDVVLLDLEMPHTHGIDALPQLIAASHGAHVLVVSSSAAQGAEVTMRALARGAADTLVKPAMGAFATRFGEVLLAKLDLLTTRHAPVPARRRHVAAVPAPFDAVAIGASTGGIHALAALTAALPPEMNRPILVTQHLPPAFSPYFAAQLGLSARRSCEVGAENARVSAGSLLIAPGDAHLVVVREPDGTVTIRRSQAPTPTGNLPSVDPMFTSMAAAYGRRMIAVVLSGMGRDGLEGARAVRQAGGTVVVQDRESSVVWGMPGVVAAAGLADAILSPAEIGAMIARVRNAA